LRNGTAIYSKSQEAATSTGAAERPARSSPAPASHRSRREKWARARPGGGWPDPGDAPRAEGGGTSLAPGWFTAVGSFPARRVGILAAALSAVVPCGG